MTVGIKHSREALIAAKDGFIRNKTTYKYALRSLFCTNPKEIEKFNQLFDGYWGKQKAFYKHKIQNQITSNFLRDSKGSLVMMGFGDSLNKAEEEAKEMSGANKMHALRKTDFSKVADFDSGVFEEIADELFRQMNNRLKRKLKLSSKGKIDIRKSIRNNLSRGDLLINLVRKNKQLEKYRLVVFLDVSGSMDKYSFFLLKFILALQSNFKDFEAFVFSTKLVRISHILSTNQLNDTLKELTASIDNWSGGTRIGECLAQFNDYYAGRILAGRNIVVILSDGLETGNTDKLSKGLKFIRKRTNKLIWLNPLKGMKGYEPAAKGMKVALPEINTFESAHNLESLLKLEEILVNV